MANKKSYNRYFIIFQEEDKGFGIAIDKQPTGYTKIETRNGKAKITVYAQNLIKEKGPYFCYLIDATKNPAVVAKLGEIKIDDTGRGETWWEHKEDDVAGTGIPVDRFNVACVAVEGEKLVSPLAGYIGKDKVLWKEKLASKPRSAENDENAEINKENEAVQNVPEENQVKEELFEENETKLDEEAKKFKKYEEIIKEDKATRNAADNIKGNKMEAKPGKSEMKPILIEDGKVNKEEMKAGNKEETKAENKGGTKASNPASKPIFIEDGAVNKEGMKTGNKEETKTSNPTSKPIFIEDAAVNKEEMKEETKASKPGFKPIVVGEPEANNAGANKPVQVPISHGSINNNPLEQTYYPNDVKEYQNLMRQDSMKEGKYARDFHGILASFEEVPALSDETNGYRWWRIPHGYDIPLKDNRLLPYYSAIYHPKMAYPYINYIKCYRGCGHYYFGLRYDNEGEVKHIAYGIEGKNTIQEQPYMGMTGFVKWVPMKDKDTGVWLMHYNPYSGSIMIPKKR